MYMTPTIVISPQTMCATVADPLAAGCKPVRVAVTVDEAGAEEAHLQAMPAGELPDLARRYATKVCLVG